MMAKKLKKPRTPEYGTCVPSEASTRTAMPKRRIASATRSSSEVLRNDTMKRRGENGGKFRDPEDQYISAGER